MQAARLRHSTSKQGGCLKCSEKIGILCELSARFLLVNYNTYSKDFGAKPGFSAVNYYPLENRFEISIWPL